MDHSILKILQNTCFEHAFSTALLDTSGLALSFDQLLTQVVDFRQQLQRCGLGRESRLGLVFPDGLDMAVAFMGTVCAGTAVPLNPKLREDEFRFYLEDLQADAVIVPSGSQSPVIAVASKLLIPVLEMAPIGGGIAGWRLAGQEALKSFDPGPIQEQDIALILHTSGTTSRPKMVPLRQRNLVASASHIAKTLRLTHQDRCLNVMPMFHIHGLMAGLLAPILAGASIVCTPGFNMLEFFTWLDRFEPTYYTAVPTMHQAVLAGVESGQLKINIRRLRFIRSSSASLPPTVMKALEDVFQAPVIESYGMTEAAHQMASNPLPPLPQKPGSVGLAAGPHIAILDVKGEIIPNGEKGEIAVRGSNVMGGYLNHPDANLSAFTNGWFRTGDEGYLDADDYLFITGRLKEMINRGGEKVTPREVDEVFLAHPSVTQAVTFAIPHRTLGEDVATAVVLKTNASVSEKDLRAYALSRLPDQKAPSRVLILKDIPKGATGKLRRIGLHLKLSDYLVAEYVAPRSEIENKLVNMVQQILKVPQVGVNDNFFCLGGDSLMAGALTNQVNTEFNVELPLGTIFRESTMAELADYLQVLSRSPPGSSRKPSFDQDTLDYLSHF